MDIDLLWAGGAVAALILFGLFLGPTFWTGVIWVGAGTFLLGLGTLAYQCLQAIHDGYWARWDFRKALAAIGFGNLSPSSGGTDGVIQWVMALPMGVGLISTGFLIAWIGIVGKTAANQR
jgi:hypothetical protein